MREYLFRAKTEPCSKDAISGKIELKPKWVYGYIDLGYMQDEKGAIISDEKAHSAYRCQYSTIGQYTGMKDKNGRRIFEGDIVKRCFTLTRGEHRKTRETQVGVVRYKNSDCAFWLENTCSLRRPWPGDTLEVIGNIHDNPELMKER